jgi:hypothetical protein
MEAIIGIRGPTENTSTISAESHLQKTDGTDLSDLDVGRTPK